MIVILGAGINGCALARELLLNGESVTLIDTADVAFGATAYSSRLIHGGLRYLEYGEFDLVRESLAERVRLLKLAPQFVRPLELAIPLETFGGGLMAAAQNLLGGRIPFASRRKHDAIQSKQPDRPTKHAQKRPGAGSDKKRGRGMLLVWAGLMLYDAYARDSTLPRHRIERVAADRMPVDSRRFRWLAVYYDAQVRYPERFTLALLEDARRIAAEGRAEFRFLNYHRARLIGEAGQPGTSNSIAIEPCNQAQREPTSPASETIVPTALVNATGAWVDLAWQGLAAPAARLMGGTKGSHCFTFHAGLRDALGGRGIYAEAADGRPIFITPLGDTTLIGTTDEPFSADPATAVAREDEVRYLLDAVNAIFPGVALARDDIAFSYCGVRPLPYVGAARTAAITRRHAIQRRDVGGLPCYSIIGGKLTTSRSLAEEAAAMILHDLGRRPSANSRERPLPGGESYPASEAQLADAQQSFAERYQLPLAAIRAVWDLFGARASEIFQKVYDDAADQTPVGDRPENNIARAADCELVPDTSLPVGVVRWVIEHEWVVTLDDLVERRLMLLYDRRVSRGALERLAQLLVDAGRLATGDAPAAVEATTRRLKQHFGKRLAD